MAVAGSGSWHRNSPQSSQPEASGINRFGSGSRPDYRHRRAMGGCLEHA